MRKLPKLSRNELVALSDLRRHFPLEFYSNKTTYFKQELIRYLKDKRVFRLSIMGETRSGKSEMGSTIAFWYIKIFNKLLDNGVYDDVDVFINKEFIKQKLTFETDFVCDNQQVYKKRLKELHKNKKLKWGQIWQIDEEKESTGGVGSMSELIEMTNLNNIIAKFMQCEIWIQPLKLETRNCPFGIKVIKKDIGFNWCLLYKIEREPDGCTIYKFLGWIKIPLHKNEQFRTDYNFIKNEWIAKEMSGRADERLTLRSDTAEMLVKDYKHYFEKSSSGKRFIYSKSKIMILINRLMIKNVINTAFNELEKEYIVEEALMVADDKYWSDQSGEKETKKNKKTEKNKTKKTKKSNI